MKRRFRLLVLLASLAAVTSCAKEAEDWGDPLAAFSFTQPASDPQAKVLPFQAPQTDEERNECTYLVYCHFYDVIRDSHPNSRGLWQQFTYAPASGPTGLNVATIGNDAQYSPLSRWRRMEHGCHLNIFIVGDETRYPLYCGQWSPDLPGVQAKVQRLDNNRLRVTFEPFAFGSSLPSTATLAVASFAIDLELGIWVAVPCELRGVKPGSTEEKVCDLLMFLSVIRPNVRQSAITAEPDASVITPGGAEESERH